jgi:ElaB/YqjD/DUF883 family membrane-anchored ribosome-binding protein
MSLSLSSALSRQKAEILPGFGSAKIRLWYNNDLKLRAIDRQIDETVIRSPRVMILHELAAALASPIEEAIMGYSDKIDEWRRRAEEKAKEIEEKYKIKERFDEGIKAAESTVKKSAEAVGDAARAGIDAVSAGAQAAQDQFTNLDDDKKVENIKDNVKRASEKAEQAFRAGAHVAGEAYKTGKAKANSVASDLGERARDYYERAQDVYNFGQAATRATGSVVDTVSSAIAWVKENPGKATIVTLSLAAGVRLGAAFPGLDVIILGRKGHWFFRSAILAYGTRKLSEKYLEFVKRQEQLIEAGQLNEAERQRVEFQRAAAKYVGAPLLGAFHIAAGVAMWSEIFSPGNIVGFPIDIILGGNPVLESIWLFSNGLICIHNGYEFIMMALADEEQVQRVVRDIKGLLPSSSAV